MAGLFWVQEGFSLFVGDDGPNNGKYLNLESILLPTLEEMTQAFYPGGAIGQIDVGGMGMKELTLGFKLKGWDDQAMNQFGIGSKNLFPYTAYGVVKDKNGNAPMEMKCIVRGRMQQIKPDDMKRGDLFGMDFVIKELLHYELYLNKNEKFYYDWFSSTWRVNGIVENADDLAILRINSGT